jgi:hypothetical protein
MDKLTHTECTQELTLVSRKLKGPNKYHLLISSILKDKELKIKYMEDGLTTYSF